MATAPDRTAKVLYLHRPHIAPADIARAARDPKAAWLRDGVPLAERQAENDARYNARHIGEFDAVLKRQRNQPHNRLLIIALLAVVPWLCLGVVVAS